MYKNHRGEVLPVLEDQVLPFVHKTHRREEVPPVPDENQVETKVVLTVEKEEGKEVFLPAERKRKNILLIVESQIILIVHQKHLNLPFAAENQRLPSVYKNRRGEVLPVPDQKENQVILFVENQERKEVLPVSDEDQRD